MSNGARSAAERAATWGALSRYFTSLKKTCRKLGISFWDYLTDRIGQHGVIPPLPEIVRERALAESAVP